MPRSVVLPAPLAPSSPVTPAPMVKVTPSSAVALPHFFVRLVALMTASPSAKPAGGVLGRRAVVVVMSAPGTPHRGPALVPPQPRTRSGPHRRRAPRRGGARPRRATDVARSESAPVRVGSGHPGGFGVLTARADPLTWQAMSNPLK